MRSQACACLEFFLLDIQAFLHPILRAVEELTDFFNTMALLPQFENAAVQRIGFQHLCLFPDYPLQFSEDVGASVEEFQKITADQSAAMVFYDYNEPVSIELPAEALDK